MKTVCGGNCMASMKDVAKMAGVGIGTVSRVLNQSGYVSVDVKERVRAAMKQLNYTPNFRAQSLKRQNTRLVALFVPTINHPFFSQIAQRLETRLDANGYKMMLVCSQGSAEKESSVIKLIVQNRVDGAIFITHHKHDDISTEYPIVTLDRHLGEHVPCITSDNFESTYRAVEHLIERGCKRVGYLGGKPSVESEVEERLKGYRAAISKHGLEERILFEEVRHGNEVAYAEKFFSCYPETDGVFVSGDVIALCAYEKALSLGRRIPEDFKLVAFDGVLGNWLHNPNVTCVRQNLDKLSEALVDELLKKIDQQECQTKIIVPCDFIQGETT